jgi:AcrR family transcriptional regulator
MSKQSHTSEQRILKAGRRLFAAHGFAHSTIRAMAAYAGVNLAAVNYHFFDKLNLYRHVVQDCLEEVLRCSTSDQATPKMGSIAEIHRDLVRILAWEIVAPSGYAQNLITPTNYARLQARASKADDILVLIDLACAFSPSEPAP